MKKANQVRPNILIIMSDQHDPAVTGCYGHSVVQTPNLDKLASRGVVFNNAYCNSPICVPSRMSFLTGKYCHQIGVWDNGSALSSEIPTFANYFEASGYDTNLCGRMHMVGTDRLHGFGRRLYDDMEHQKTYHQKPDRTKDARRKSDSHVTECGPGSGSWQIYDNTATDLTIRFLENQPAYPTQKPWLMVTGLMFPHFPLIAPEEYFNLYSNSDIIYPNLNGEVLESQHPVIQQIRYWLRNEREVPDDILKKALTSYYALVTFTDYNIGRMVNVIDHSSLKDNTVIIYLSDHGEMAGQHGMWQKFCFYEASVKVPMIIRFPHGFEGTCVNSNVSLVDIMPTILDIAGIDIPEGLAGQSLMDYIKGTGDPQRPVFSEYHAMGMMNAGFMLKKQDFKYNYYVGYAPQLFNLRNDVQEFSDISSDVTHEVIVKELHQELLNIVDPIAVDEEAKENQKLEGEKRAFKKYQR